MSQSSFTVRASLLAAAIALTATGCGWFHKGNKLYAGPASSRPLEVPPDLDTSAPAPAMASGVTASATQQAATQASLLGFAVEGSREDVFARLGDAIAAVPGARIANRAPLLGAYDVDYSGSNFLVRVSAGTGGGSYVAAVDPRGLPASGDAARRLIAALKASLVR